LARWGHDKAIAAIARPVEAPQPQPLIKATLRERVAAVHEFSRGREVALVRPKISRESLEEFQPAVAGATSNALKAKPWESREEAAQREAATLVTVAALAFGIASLPGEIVALAYEELTKAVNWSRTTLAPGQRLETLKPYERHGVVAAALAGMKYWAEQHRADAEETRSAAHSLMTDGAFSDDKLKALLAGARASQGSNISLLARAAVVVALPMAVINAAMVSEVDSEREDPLQVWAFKEVKKTSSTLASIIEQRMRQMQLVDTDDEVVRDAPSFNG
jgi:hypothetical protein